MKKQFDIHRSDLEPGDVIIVAMRGNPYIVIEREVPDTPTKITREQFLKVMDDVVQTNGLNVGTQYVTAVVYAADRLGLR
jgi:hypothetical protein